jgi:hypothetical protein
MHALVERTRPRDLTDTDWHHQKLKREMDYWWPDTGSRLRAEATMKI